MMQPETDHAHRIEMREHSKLEGNLFESNEAHTSQPSTIGSLGNLEEQKTPTSSKMQQIEKLGMEIGQKLRKKTQTQVKSIRSMILRVFGEKVDPVRDVDAATRVLLERLNEDIRKLPKRKERIIEGEGQGPIIQALPESLPNPLGTISEMGTKLAHHMPHHMPSINEMRDKISQHMPNVKKELHDVEDAAMHQLEHLKQKFIQTFGEKVNPAKDLDPSVKDKLTRLNEDIRKIPRRNETVIETQGTAEETKEHLLFWGLDHLAYNR